MARNDLVLLDSLIDKSKENLGRFEESEYFELFCFDNILKDFEPSYEELEQGWVDGGDDGGIDGFFVILDGVILTDSPDGPFRRNPKIDLFIITAKRSPTFKQAPLNALISSLPELLDLTKKEEELQYPFASHILEQRNLFRDLYITLADKYPKLCLYVIYASRGASDKVGRNIMSRASILKSELISLFSKATIETCFYGAKEILELARKQKSYSLRLRFIETNISRESTNYVVLGLLKDYFQFVTDEDGHLRRYLFESNVRDYLGQVAINRDIAETLASNETLQEMDFWWLNNGITLLASEATIAGKELSLENVQIVNGLQTTETIYRYFTANPDINDDRAVLLKVIVTSDESVRDRIIKATNYQNMVDPASLRGTDKIQRDIEHFLIDNGWFYDRRKGFYKNQGKPAESIVSISHIGSAVQAIALRNFSTGFVGKTKWLRDDEIYSKVFNEKLDLRVYLACLELSRTVENILKKNGWRKGGYGRRAVAFAISSILAARNLNNSNYKPEDLIDFIGFIPPENDVMKIWNDLGIIRGVGRRKINILENRVNSLLANC